MAYSLSLPHFSAFVSSILACSIASAGCSNVVQEGQGGALSSSTSGSPAANGSTGATSPTSTGSGQVIGAEPPPAPQGAPPGDGTAPVAFAFTQIFVGSTDRNGVESPTAWNAYGFDIDHQVTAADFSMHCKPNTGASPADTFPDGLDGRDNSFGKSIIPIFKSAAMGSDIQVAANAEIQNGTATSILDLANLGMGSTYDPLAAFYFRGEVGTAIAWQVQPEFLNGSTPDTAKEAFPQSYLTNNTWVSGPGTLSLPLSLGSMRLNLAIHSAIIAMDLDVGHTHALDGTIGGVLDTEEFVTEVKKAIGAFDPSLCTGTTVDSILNRIRQTSDIMKNGTQDGSKTCDGISIGLGFTAAATNLGPLGPNAQPQPNPCN